MLVSSLTYLNCGLNTFFYLPGDPGEACKSLSPSLVHPLLLVETVLNPGEQQWDSQLEDMVWYIPVTWSVPVSLPRCRKVSASEESVSSDWVCDEPAASGDSQHQLQQLEHRQSYQVNSSSWRQWCDDVPDYWGHLCCQVPELILNIYSAAPWLPVSPTIIKLR